MEEGSGESVYQRRMEEFKDEIGTLVQNMRNQGVLEGNENAGTATFEALTSEAMNLVNKDQDAGHFIAMAAYNRLFPVDDTPR